MLHFIDNTAALAGLTKGYSRVVDSAHIVHAFHAWNVAIGAHVWFEYVRSEANPSDEPSRNLELAATLSVGSGAGSHLPARPHAVPVA